MQYVSAVDRDSSGAQQPPECVVFIGLPAAGKTLFYQQQFAGTHRHVSNDLRSRAVGTVRSGREEMDEALARGQSVVVDNTHPRRKDRAPILTAARAAGARIVGYFFDVSTREAIARNAARTGTERVPNVAIFVAAKRLEPPSLEEGFDRLFRVRIAPDRSLVVSEMI